MAGRVHQVQLIGDAVLRGVFEAHGLGLDGDAALALDVHGVEHLLFHVPVSNRVGGLDQAVSQRGFPVVDVRDDGEIADVG